MLTIKFDTAGKRQHRADTDGIRRQRCGAERQRPQQECERHELVRQVISCALPSAMGCAVGASGLAVMIAPERSQRARGDQDFCLLRATRVDLGTGTAGAGASVTGATGSGVSVTSVTGAAATGATLSGTIDTECSSNGSRRDCHWRACCRSVPSHRDRSNHRRDCGIDHRLAEHHGRSR